MPKILLVRFFSGHGVERERKRERKLERKRKLER